jgi:hypothetical protein
MVKHKPYKEGDWFAVPLTSGYVLARIARVGRRGGILLGYFFKPLRTSLPTPQDMHGLTSADAFNIGKFGDRGLVEDGWPIIDSPKDWSREDWPMPMFGRLGTFNPETGLCVKYDENDLTMCLGERAIPVEQVLQLPKDGMAGHIFLQRKLEKYFKEGSEVYDPAETHRVHSWFHGLPDIALDAPTHKSSE